MSNDARPARPIGAGKDEDEDEDEVPGNAGAAPASSG
ncbi:hypothetical protein UKMH10_1089 [Burkholderia pseudomallei]|nr:unnamed protein product [Burkholderia pseudomallei]VUD45260.1 unnamed protein product [Burkholderia pseudomallei]VUD45449.1 hypothetical protein UKMH10_1089 [Burkholderia pseudomallei]